MSDYYTPMKFSFFNSTQTTETLSDIIRNEILNDNIANAILKDIKSYQLDFIFCRH